MPVGQAACGTMPGWRRHNTLGTEPCMPCAVARSNWDRDRKLAPLRRQILLEALAGFDRYPTDRRPGYDPCGIGPGPEWYSEQAYEAGVDVLAGVAARQRARA